MVAKGGRVGSSGGTISLIAREAGCSVSTVSRVLNGCRTGFSVRRELEERIQTLAREFDYKPNPYLRSMRAKKTRIVAVFDPLYHHPGVVSQAKVDFIDEIHRHGYTEAAKYVDLNAPESYRVDFPMDAALLFDVCDGECLNFCENNHTPYVVVNGICRAHGVSILVDEAADVRLLVDHLTGCGHRKIAYFTGHFDAHHIPQHYSCAERQKYYLEELSRRGLAPVPEYWNEQIDPETFLRKCVIGEGATAVISYDHRKTAALMNAAWRLGIAIPERLSIVCFNDEFPLEVMNPPVTCVATPGRAMGELAVKLMLGLLDGSLTPEGQTHKVAGSLVLRQSVAAPAEA